MKPKVFTAILLFVSAYSPLFLILVVKDFDFNNYCLKHPVPDAVLLSITVLSIVLLFVTVAKINRGNMVVTVKAVQNRSLDIINYTIPYLFTAFDIDLSKPEDIITISLFLSILLVLTVSSQSIFINPLLALRGYAFYDLEYEFEKKMRSVIVISKDDLQVNHRYYVRSLTRFLYFVTAEKKESNTNES
ncbi:MAG TPA: hypothetical protein VEC12_01445 [Bacteroidia bacterium]|nr:hypothetical protein [Bacteroidia bacterium]